MNFMIKLLNLMNMKSLNEIGKKVSVNKLKIIGIITGLFCLCVSCELSTDQDTKVTYYEEYNLSITQYIESQPDNFSILYNILDTTGLDHLFRTYGDYTFLAPENSAFEDYFKKEGKSSYLDFTKEELTQLIKYHIFNTRILAGSFNSGLVGSKTLSSKYMVSGLSDDGSDIILNKSANIITQDIILPNGILHVIDKVLEKPEASIYDWLKENESEYGIFLEAVEKTGWDQTFNKPDTGSDDFYTCFVTPDSKYNESNINSFADLAERISPDDNNYTDSSNTLRAFIGSHFLKDPLSMSDATEDQVFYGSVGGATAKFGLKPNSAEVVLNYGTPEFPDGLDIDEYNSNNLVSNGIIHIMDTMFLTTKSFERTWRYFVFVDVPGIPYDSLYDYGVYLWDDLGIYAKETEQNGAKGSEKWIIGQQAQFWPSHSSTTKHIPFEATNGWLTLNAPYSGYITTDHHRNNEHNDKQDYLYGMTQPIFFTNEKCDDLLDITRKFPYIIPGKYKLINHTKLGGERPVIKHTFDGEPIGGMFNLTAGQNFTALELGVVEIKEGETEHYLQIQEVTPGKLFLVAISFVPVD